MFLFYSNCTIIIHDGQISTMMVEHHPGLSVVFVLLNLLPVWYLLYFINHCLSLWTRSFGHYVAHLFKLMSCSSMCLYVLSSVLCCPVRFLHNNYVRFVFTSRCLQKGPCFICFVFLFYFSSSCVPYVASFSGLSIFLNPLTFLLLLRYTASDYPSWYLKTYLITLLLLCLSK